MRPPLAAVLLLLLLCAAPRAGVLGDDLNDEEDDDYVSLPRLRLAVDYGYSHAIVPEDTLATSAGKEYQDDAQNARNLSADLVWYFVPRGGIGLSWIWFLSRAEAENLVLHKGDVPTDFEERASFTYYGAACWTRLRLGRYGLAHVGFGAGWLGIRDNWSENGEPYRVKAETFALVTSLGWDWSFMRYLGLGLDGRFLFSNLKEWTLNGEKVKLEDPADKSYWTNVPLYRLEINAGLRFFL